MSQTETPAPTDIEAFQSALELAEQNECDAPESALLLRALKVYRILQTADAVADVYVAEDGTIELSAEGNAYHLTVVVERARLALLVTQRRSGEAVVADDHASEDQILEWVAKAA